MSTGTRTGLDLADIQGDVLRAYGNRFTHASYVFVGVGDAGEGRRWLAGLVDRVTSALPWTHPPQSTLNLAFTAAGLRAVGLSERLLATFSREFRDGMAARATLLGDVGASAPEHWDDGLGRGDAHVLLVVKARSQEALDDRLRDLRAGLAACPSLAVVHEEHARLLPHVREHFGFADGFAQPAVEGVTDSRAPGGGVLDGNGWRPLAAGEFVLGHPDEESRGDPSAPLPSAPADPLGRNGTYAVWRKLEQDVDLFRRTLSEQAGSHGVTAAALAAKVVGRWQNGTPLVVSPAGPDEGFRPNAPGANDFRYAGSDPAGHRCPIGAHIRRCNPRDSIGFGDRLTFRHRMIRRGMPYGPPLPADATEPDGHDRGLVFVCFAASISRQFESVQVQWLEDGNAFGLGSDKDFLMRGPADGTGKMTVQGSPAYLLAPQPSFVRMRGGEYLFVPGRTALGVLADGTAGA